MGVTLKDKTLKDLIMPVVKACLEELLPSFTEEAELNIWAKRQQTIFNQTELAQRLNVSTETIRRWRKIGLPVEQSATTELNFDINKVNQWKEENGIR